ncbi:uncharacterized protein LOC122402395 [Colletes gigas]|uniref:uncharacterized protein LOC122402395 n=1 Tax=Colletes gigas TaxID=935657 RepID=UPI001C9A384B|nr:uncharacterized protein LOC122402395 [Colletes gigas]
MVTLQDISMQLMKPAKDLADWKFPLSQVLEEYYALLEDPCNINFGEAALVLQNSTNVYVRRIECLLNEIEVLKQIFFVYEEEEIKKSREKRVPKKVYIDLENFVIRDLEAHVGKNINKRDQLQTQKKIKLLSHRFTQLENNVAQLCNHSIHVYDVLGEIIGKKYDFRCNQAINTSGMLVDELTPYDFTRVHSSRVQKGRNSLSSYSEPKTPGTGTSGYQSATSLNDNEFLTSIHEEFEEDHDFSLQMEDDFAANESHIVEKENIINRDRGIPFANSNISPFIAENVASKKQHTQNNLPQDPVDINDVNCKETNQTKRKHQNENSGQTTRIEECPKNKKYKKCGATERMANDSKQSLDRISKEDKLRIAEMDKLDSIQWKEGLFGMQKKGNQSTKISICSVDDVNEFDWKPMPFIQGMKSECFEDPSVLKLPEYFSLLETKFGSKKRKVVSKIYKPECLTKLISYEAGLLTIKEKDFILRAKKQFKCLHKKELEDFIKNCDDCLNITRRDYDTSGHKATRNVILDLLDFRIAQNQNNFIENDTEEIPSRNSTPSDLQLQSISHNSLDITEQSHNLCDSWYEPSVSEIDVSYSLPDYQSLIEGKMKEIFEESNVATELDQAVAKWHASLQSKLSEAEIRPTFRIHDYTARIMGTLQALDQKKINFDSVVRDKPACEVARYFLASLQLANTYDVEIETKNSDSSIEITLLSDGKESETC